MNKIKSTKEIDDLTFPFYLSDDSEYNSFAHEYKVIKLGNEFYIRGIGFSHRESGLEQSINFVSRKINKNELKSLINNTLIRGHLGKLSDSYKRHRIRLIFRARKVRRLENGAQ